MKPTMSHLWLLTLLTVSAGASVPAQETNQIDPRSFDFFKLITDRNIFDPNRRPARIDTAREEPRVVDSFALTGTISYSNLLVAIFDGSKSDYHKALEAGDQIAGHDLTQIRYDAVKLASGTNEFELKVGMQMRRSDDGNWSIAESSGSYGSSYGSSSRRRSGRRDYDSGRYSSRNSSQRDSRSFGASDDRSDTSSETDLAGGLPEMPPGSEMEPPPPDQIDDPVARMMARRQRETGGGPEGNQNENEN